MYYHRRYAWLAIGSGNTNGHLCSFNRSSSNLPSRISSATCNKHISQYNYIPSGWISCFNRFENYYEGRYVLKSAIGMWGKDVLILVHTIIPHIQEVHDLFKTYLTMSNSWLSMVSISQLKPIRTLWKSFRISNATLACELRLGLSPKLSNAVTCIGLKCDVIYRVQKYCAA